MTGPRFDDDRDYFDDYDFVTCRDGWAPDYDGPREEARPVRACAPRSRVTGERQASAAPPTIATTKGQP